MYDLILFFYFLFWAPSSELKNVWFRMVKKQIWPSQIFLYEYEKIKIVSEHIYLEIV